MDIANKLDKRVVARQMRCSILEYMASEEFNPSLTLSPEIITHLFEREAPRVDMFTKDSPDELKPKLTPWFVLNITAFFDNNMWKMRYWKIIKL